MLGLGDGFALGAGLALGDGVEVGVALGDGLAVGLGDADGWGATATTGAGGSFSAVGVPLVVPSSTTSGSPLVWASRRLPRLPQAHRGRTQIVRASAGGGVLFRLVGGGRWLAVGRRSATGPLTLRRIARYLAILGGLAVLVAALVSYLLADAALLPLRRVAHTASEIARSGEIDRRLGAIGTGEMGELSRAFDAMLDRLAHAIGRPPQAASAVSCSARP